MDAAEEQGLDQSNSDESYLPDGRFPCRDSESAVSLASGGDFDSSSSVGSLFDEHTNFESFTAAHPQLKCLVVLEVCAAAIASKGLLGLLGLLIPRLLFNLTYANMYTSFTSHCKVS